MTRRGFTLLETALATVIGAMIVLACVGLFTAVNRAETALSRRASEVTEFAMTQRTIRRALLTLVMMPASSRPDPNAEPDPEAARSGADIEPVEMPPGRLVIEPDRAPSIETMILAASADGVRLPPISGMDLGHPQRVEVVLAVPPVPPGLADAGARWSAIARADAQIDVTEGVADADSGEEAGLRGVFELRPDGFRERVIAGFGITPATSLGDGPVDERGEALLPRRLREPARGWTLWWRPVYAEERAARAAGMTFDPDIRPESLTEAVALARGLTGCRFSAFALDREAGVGNRFTEFIAWASEDLPGYIEVEVRTAGGRYANWMLEVGWQVADEIANPDDPEGEDALEGQDGVAEDGQGGGGNAGGRSGATSTRGYDPRSGSAQGGDE